jgi:hypothetical protein
VVESIPKKEMQWYILLINVDEVNALFGSQNAFETTYRKIFTVIFFNLPIIRDLCLILENERWGHSQREGV